MAPNKTRMKKLYYRRAVWAAAATDTKILTLQDMLVSAHEQLATVGDRTFAISNGVYLRGADFKEDDGIYFQISSYVPDEEATVIDKNPKAKQSNVTPYAAPLDNDYVNGEIFVYVKGNDIILCAATTRETSALMYFKSVLYKTNYSHASTTLSFNRVAQFSQLKLIRDEGVKEIELNASLYEASRMELDSTSGFKRVIAEHFMAIFGKDKDLSEIKEQENLNVKLSISFDGAEARLKEHKKEPNFGEAGLQRLEKTAEKILEDVEHGYDDDGFVIITGRGTKITAEQIQISEMQRIKTLGQSLSKIDAWDKLRSYYVSLNANGALKR